MRMDWKPLEIARIGSCLEKGWGEQAAGRKGTRGNGLGRALLERARSVDGQETVEIASGIFGGGSTNAAWMDWKPLEIAREILGKLWKQLGGAPATLEIQRLARVFQNKFNQRDCAEKNCAQDLSNGFQTLGDGTCVGESSWLEGFLWLFMLQGVLPALRPLTLAATQTKREPKHRRCLVWFHSSIKHLCLIEAKLKRG